MPILGVRQRIMSSFVIEWSIAFLRVKIRWNVSRMMMMMIMIGHAALYWRCVPIEELLLPPWLHIFHAWRRLHVSSKSICSERVTFWHFTNDSFCGFFATSIHLRLQRGSHICYTFLCRKRHLLLTVSSFSATLISLPITHMCWSLSHFGLVERSSRRRDVFLELTGFYSRLAYRRVFG